MKKILMYTTDKLYTGTRVTGGMRRFKALYEGLVNNGYNVDLYCGDNKFDLLKFNPIANSIDCENITQSKIFPNFQIMLKNIKLLWKLRKNEYNKVIVFDVPTAISLCLMKFKHLNLFLRQDLIEYRKILLNDKNKGKVYKFLYLKFMNLCERICCLNSEKIIVQCSYDLENLIDRHNDIKDIIVGKSYIQINNINIPWITEKSKVVSTSKMKLKSYKIGFVGDFSNSRKGHELLLKVIKKLLDYDYDIEAYLIGDGRDLKKFKDNYSKYDKIHFLGRLENPIEIVKEMDLMVVPSLADSCPNTVLESIYNDILVIGAKSGGIPEIINNSEATFEINEESLYKKIEQIVNNKQYSQKLKKQQKGRKKDLLFNWEEKIIEILKDDSNANKKNKTKFILPIITSIFSLLYLVRSSNILSIVGFLSCIATVILLFIYTIKDFKKIDKVVICALLYCLYLMISLIFNFSFKSVYIVFQQNALLLYAICIYRRNINELLAHKICRIFKNMYYILLSVFLLVALTNNLPLMKENISHVILKLLVPLSFFYLYSSKNRRFMTILSAITVFALGERLTGLLFIVVLILDFFITEKNLNKVKFIFISMIVVLAILIPLLYTGISNTDFGHLLNNKVKEITGEQLFSGRNLLWNEVLNASKGNELFGLGFDNTVLKDYGTELSTHNLYLWVILSGGYFLLALFFAFIISIYMKYFETKNFLCKKYAIINFISIFLILNFELLLLNNNFVISLYMWFVLMFPLAINFNDETTKI